MTDEANDKARRVGLFAVAALLVAILLLPASAQPQNIHGKVVGVSDGDTITMLDQYKRRH